MPQGEMSGAAAKRKAGGISGAPKSGEGEKGKEGRNGAGKWCIRAILKGWGLLRK